MSFSDWKEIPLEEAIEKLIDYRGKTPEKTFSGIPLITAKIVKDGKINTPQEFIDEDDYEAWMVRGFPKKGDVVLTTEAPLGEVASIDDENIALAQRIVVLRGKKGLLDNTYLKYHLMSHDIQHQLQSRASGSTVLGIKQSELRKIILKIPPMKVQQKIGDNLDLLYQLSKQNETIFSNLDSIISALFRSWFIDFDPVKAKSESKFPYRIYEEAAALFPNSFEDSKFGPIPTGWKYMPIGDVTNIVYGKNLPTSKLIENGFPVFGANGIIGYHESFMYAEEQVLVSCRGEASGAVSITSPNCFITNNSLIMERKYKSMCSNYLFQILSSSDLDAYVTGSAQPQMTINNLKQLKILVPTDDVLLAFEEKIRSMTLLSGILKKQSKSLTKTRDTLLPRLMSGELSLS